MGNEHHKEHKSKDKSKKRASQDDSSVVVRKESNKISLDDNNNHIQPMGLANYHSTNTYSNNYTPYQIEYHPQVSSIKPHQPSFFNQNQSNQQMNMPSYNDYFKKVQQSQQIPSNDKVTKEDLHLIVECIKKCDEKYQQGCLEINSNKNFSKALEFFTKTKSSLQQLKEIIKAKQYLPPEFTQAVSAQLNEKISFTSEALRQCTSLMNSQQSSNKSNKEIYQSQFIQSNNSSANRTNHSNPPKKRKGDDETSEAFEAKIESEILMKVPNVKFSDIVGMKNLKQIIYEIVVMPSIRPDIFIGLRKPQRGLLLFGPPGTGKTMIAKAIAGECASTFFNISASSLTSKWIGESEKTVRALFQLAYKRSPSIIFIDEIESVLSKRSENDNEVAKRLKTEFLIQFDGLATNSEAKLLVIAATNRPMDLDDALLRRLPKRVYCGPLDLEGRGDFIRTVMKTIDNKLSNSDIHEIAVKTENYSNSDLKELCREASYQPVRELTDKQINKIKKLRPIVLSDFLKAIHTIRGTITLGMVSELDKWNRQFGALD